MSEHNIGLREFDKTNQHAFESTCTQGVTFDQVMMNSYGIKRTQTSEGVETSYPNGITVTRFKEGDFMMTFPDGLKHRETKDGLTAAVDKKGRVAAYMSADGNVLMPSSDKVLQENKSGEISLNDVGCFDKKVKTSHEPQVIVMPELVITGKAPHKNQRIESRKTQPAHPVKPFNWDSNDPLEGIDLSGY